MTTVAARPGPADLGAPVRLPWSHLLASWLIARLLTAVLLVVASPLMAALHQRRSRHAHGLLGWDASWYDRIATGGYDPLPRLGLRFFPLVPALARGFGVLLLGHPGLALLLLANGAALLLGVLVHRLAVRCGLGARAAVRAVWATALAPAGFVLVMGYAEPVWACLVAGFLLALLDRRWQPAAALGALAALSRPTGVLIVIPAAVELVRHRDLALHDLRRRDLRPLLPVVAPAAALLAWLAVVGARYGDPLLPFRAQADQSLRGGLLVDPLPVVADGLRALPADVLPVVTHLPWVLLSLLLLAVAARRLPLSLTLYAAASLALALTAARFSSYERYAGTTVPLLLAAGAATRHRLPRWGLTTAAVATFSTYAVLALAGTATP